MVNGLSVKYQALDECEDCRLQQDGYCRVKSGGIIVADREYVERITDETKSCTYALTEDGVQTWEEPLLLQRVILGVNLPDPIMIGNVMT